MYTTIKNIFLSLLLIILCGYTLFAQNITLPDPAERNKYNFSQLGKETWNFIKQPTKWNGCDWLKIGLIGAGTFLIIETVDQPVRDVVLENQQYYNSVPIRIGNMWGDWYPTVIISSAFALHGWLDDNTSSKK